jgi:hypothetical protein
MAGIACQASRRTNEEETIHILEVCTIPYHGVVVEDDNYHPLGRGNGMYHGM